MSLLTLGLNHKTAPLEIREQTVFVPEKIDSALQELMAVPNVSEAAIFSTCNRTEIYCHTAEARPDQTLDWFLTHHDMRGLDHDTFLYHYVDAKAVQHLIRVACGLDSMVLGEPQILGQLKSAYRHAASAGTIGQQLGKLFQHAFAAAKQVRSETSIGANPVSVAFAAVKLAQQIFTDLKQQTALLIGAGETIELVARHLRDNAIGNIIIANRSLERAESLAKQTGANAIRLADLGDCLAQGDIIVSSTASQLPIIGKGAIESALQQRKHKPMFMVDIAVPRDVEPQVSNLQDVYLYNIDDLEAVIEQNRRSRAAAAEQAEAIINLKVDEFVAWQHSLDGVEVIREYRDNAQQQGQLVLEKARKLIASGKSHDEVLRYLANTLTNKLLHDATVNIHNAAREGREDLLKAAQELFKLERNNK